MTEAFLHYVWQHQLLNNGLTTTDGQPVVVYKPGTLNHDAGPDFNDARLQIGDIEWVGNVEIHIHTSDWRSHRHSTDAAYNNVVLHVVYEHDCEIRLKNGNIPPTLELKPYLHAALVENYDKLTSPTTDGMPPCADRLASVPAFVLTSFMDRLATERIERKSAIVHRMLAENNGGWEQTCYQLVAHYFGGKVNALAFELLAKATDQRLLARWKDDVQRIEALLMGQAGLLDSYFEDEYPRMLQADYASLRNGASLQPIDGYLWKFYCLRPTAFPTIRISQFAHLVCSSTNLFAKLLETTDAREMERLFCQRASEYWDTHYQFDNTAPRKSAKNIGRMQAQMIIINACVPLIYVYGEVHQQQRYKEQAMALLAQIDAEDNNIVRRWDAAGIRPANAADSQALLQLDGNYCQPRRCLECRIGYHILKHL